ncbi:MAG: helix-turn-helix domain-containing protein, partial [Bacteroidetes bacterium]|nr:helix-turn-helix domain-containing protein [Bacteroidota bacterium]
MLNKFAQELKKAREKADITLQNLSARSRLDIKFLQSIEKGDFSFLPELYVKAFIKGDFTTGLKLTGNTSGNSPNANTYIGGGVFSTTSGGAKAGSRGIWVEFGTGNAFFGLDLKGFETNLDCEDDDNIFFLRHEQGVGTTDFYKVSGDRNFYVSMTHAASGITDTGS